MPATVVTPITALNIGAGGTLGSAALATDNTNGNSFVQDGKTLLRLVNTDASSHTVTFTYPVQVDGQTVPSKVVTMAASAIVWIACGLASADRVLYPSNVITFTSNSNLVKYELVTYLNT